MVDVNKSIHSNEPAIKEKTIGRKMVEKIQLIEDENSSGNRYWYGKYIDVKGNTKKIIVQIDASDYDEADIEFEASIPEPYTKYKMWGDFEGKYSYMGKSLSSEGYTYLTESDDNFANVDEVAESTSKISQEEVLQHSYTDLTLDDLSWSENSLYRKYGEAVKGKYEIVITVYTSPVDGDHYYLSIDDTEADDMFVNGMEFGSVEAALQYANFHTRD